MSETGSESGTGTDTGTGTGDETGTTGQGLDEAPLEREATRRARSVEKFADVLPADVVARLRSRAGGTEGE